MKVLRENERGDETQFTTKIGGKTSLGPQLFSFVEFHSQLSIWCPIMPKLAVLALQSPDFTDNFIRCKHILKGEKDNKQ